MSGHKGKIAFSMTVLFLIFTAIASPQNPADVTAGIKCPGTAVPGQELGKTIQVTVRNLGQAPAARFAVDLVLSTDTSVPIKYAVYSANFSEDCLLQGGREHEFNLGGGETRNVTLNGNNRIPADTPPGTYYLAVVIDPGEEVSESNERNNVAFCRIQIGKDQQQSLTPVLRPHVLAKLKVPVPVQVSPADGSRMTHYPRKVTLRWREVSKATYDVEIDCLHCRINGQWDSQNGAPWKTASDLTANHYDFVFVGDNQGRWRVRAVRGKARSDWSPWWGFSFDTGTAATQPQGKPDLGMYGFIKLGKNKREVRWGESITLTPADATLVSNGTPAFEVYYACREFDGYPAGPFQNKLYFRKNLVSKQTQLQLKPREVMPIHTQAYLGPMDGRLQVKIDAENDVSESREDNNFHFFVKLRFKGFKPPKEESQRLPDLVVKDVSLVQDCKIKVTIANVGAAGVPDSGYDMNNGVAIQMYRFSDPWGGIRLGAVDPAGNLKSPGSTVSWIWFPGASNLNLTPGVHSIKVVVDKDNAVTESNESNNHLTRRLICEKEAEEGPAEGEPCGIKLDRIHPDKGRSGTVFRMYGQWGATQGSKIPAINRGNMNKLIVLNWTPTVLVVRVPPGLTPGEYKVGVYCNDPAAGTTYSSGWMDFRVQ